MSNPSSVGFTEHLVSKTFNGRDDLLTGIPSRIRPAVTVFTNVQQVG
jgi:hypothetical protein